MHTRQRRHFWLVGMGSGGGCAISASSLDSFALCSSHFPPVSDPRPLLHFNPPPASPRPDRGAGAQWQRGSCPLWVAKRFTVWKIPIPCIISLTTSSASPWLCGNAFVPPLRVWHLRSPLFFFPSVSHLSVYICSVMSLLLLCLIPPTSEPFNSCSLVLCFSLPFVSVCVGGRVKKKKFLKTEKLYELKKKKKKAFALASICTSPLPFPATYSRLREFIQVSVVSVCFEVLQEPFLLCLIWLSEIAGWSCQQRGSPLPTASVVED